MEKRIQRNGNKLVKEVLNTNQQNGWKQKTKILKQEIEITDENTTRKKIEKSINLLKSQC